MSLGQQKSKNDKPWFIL